jgi:hypothetical protein
MAWFCRTQQDKSCEGTWLLIFSQWPINDWMIGVSQRDNFAMQLIFMNDAM